MYQGAVRVRIKQDFLESSNVGIVLATRTKPLDTYLAASYGVISWREIGTTWGGIQGSRADSGDHRQNDLRSAAASSSLGMLIPLISSNTRDMSSVQ